jgi:hypothetical protein
VNKIAGINKLYLAVIAGALVLPAVFFGSAGGETAQRFHLWGDSLALDPRVMVEIERYEKEEAALGRSYSLKLAAGIRQLVLARAGSQIEKIIKGDRNPLVEVSFPDPGFAAKEMRRPERDAERDFEKGFILTEVVAFFEAASVTPQAALDSYTRPDFRMSVSSRIKRIWPEDELSCIEIDGVKVVLSPTSTCSRIEEYHSPGLSVQHSQVVSNGGDDGNQAVYFKESLKTFVAIPGGVALHYINYTRAVDMGWLGKKISPGKIKDSRRKAIEELAKRLAGITAASGASVEADSTGQH